MRFVDLREEQKYNDNSVILVQRICEACLKLHTVVLHVIGEHDIYVNRIIPVCGPQTEILSLMQGGNYSD